MAALEAGRSLILCGGCFRSETSASLRLHLGLCPPGSAGRDGQAASPGRYAYARWWAPLIIEPVEAVNFAMSQKMLRGIRGRAERTGYGGAPPSERPGPCVFPGL